MTVPLRLFVRRNGVAPSTGDDEVQISVQVPSSLDVVDETIDIVVRHCLACDLSTRLAEFNLRFVLGEALQNAILYGNREDPDKSVDLRIHVGRERVEIHVRDQGDGFNPALVPDPRLPDRIEEEEGRGLFLIRQLVDDVTFNDRGNSICMVLLRA